MIVNQQKVDEMCEHSYMEKLDELRATVELWGCSYCDYEEVRVYVGPDDYIIA